MKPEIKLTLTRWERYKITIYHLYEPLIVGSAVGVCLQLPDLLTLIYTLITFCGLTPLLLTDKLIKIKFKRVLAYSLICLSNMFIIFKAVAYSLYDRMDRFKSDEEVAHFFGVYKDSFIKTFGSDFAIFFISIIAVICYND